MFSQIITHHKVLKSIGIDVDITTAQAARQLADPEIGWAYLDQKNFNARLYQLTGLRERMIKRSALTTIEVLLNPIRGLKKTHFVTGYVHTAYPPVYAELARFAGFDSALILRGVEGGITPSLQQVGKYFYYHDQGEELRHEADPVSIGIKATKRAEPLPADLPEAAEGHGAIHTDAASVRAAEIGVSALQGNKGLAYDSLVYSASICLAHLKKYGSLAEAANEVRRVLDSGAVLQRLRSAGANI